VLPTEKSLEAVMEIPEMVVPLLFVMVIVSDAPTVPTMTVGN
jgi:hypothetical protein